MTIQKILESTFRMILALGIAAALGACRNQNNGGVDGSGGDLSFFAYDSFSDWVKNDHPAYVRDVIHRLVLMKKSNLDDFQPHKDLAEKFFGPDPDQLLNLVAKAKFFTAQGACPSSTHPANDAAIYPDGRICFSYAAFKNFPIEVMLKKLLVMTMHEISHLRGFDEDDATKWQLLFEGRLSNVILTGNSNYRDSHEKLTSMASNLGVALKILLERDKNAKIHSCEYLARAEEHTHRYLVVAQFLPKYLNEKAQDVVLNLIDLALSCGDLTEQEVARTLSKLLKDFSSLFRDFEQFESPFCKGNICVGRRPFNPSPDYMLMAWSALEKPYLTNEPYAEPSGHAMCEVHDVSTGQGVPLVWIDGRADIPLGESQHQLTLSLQGQGSLLESYLVPIKLEHNGPVQLVEGQGFEATGAFWMNGVLQPGVSERTHARIALMETPQESHEVGQPEWTRPSLPYYLFDPYLLTIRHEPTIQNQYDIDCWLVE